MALATSKALPTFFKGFRFSDASIFSGELINFSDNGVSVKDGATQLTLINGANSADKALVNPSMAHFAIDIDE